MPKLILCFVSAILIFSIACTSGEQSGQKPDEVISNVSIGLLNFRTNDLRWVPSRLGQPLPPNAIVGGIENTAGINAGKNLYICRARWGNGMHPGKLLDGKCNIEYNGEEETAGDYEVLTGTTYAWRYGPGFEGFWEPSQRRNFQGGWENGGCLYICRGEPGRGWHPGKYLPNTQHCHYAYGGGKNTDDITEFQILYVPGNSFNCNPNPTPTPPAAPPPPPPTEGYLEVNFTTGTTADTPGRFWLMNGKTGQSSGQFFTNFNANQSREACAAQLNAVAASIGLRTAPNGAIVRIYGAGNTIRIDNRGFGPSTEFRCYSVSGQEESCE